MHAPSDPTPSTQPPARGRRVLARATLLAVFVAPWALAWAQGGEARTMPHPASSEPSWAGAVLLGVLQGLTEFLPVSSSGHLVLFQQFIAVTGDAILFDLALHLGTLVPAMWFYRADIAGVVRDATGVGEAAADGPWLKRPGVRLAVLVVVASVPTGLIGLLFKDAFEELFHSPAAVGLAFALTGALLWSTRGRDTGTRGIAETSLTTAALIGLAQGFAITPGISRSGSTIAAALLLGLEREFAVKLSFLMSIPAISGAALLKARDVEGLTMDPLQVAGGTLAALFTGYAALVLLVRLVRRGRFADFSYYLWCMAVVALGVGALYA